MDDYTISPSQLYDDAPPHTTAADPHSRRLLPFSPSLEYLSSGMEHDLSPQSASPEVISNLITSLSAISAPVENHFNNMPDIDDNPGHISYSPRPIFRAGHTPKKHLSRSPSRPNGLGKEYWAADHVPEEEEDSYLDAENAAAAPVIHFVKPSASVPSFSYGRSSPSRSSLRRSQQSPSPDNAAAASPSIGLSSAEPYLPASSVKGGPSRYVRKTTSNDAFLDSPGRRMLRNGKSSSGLSPNVFGRSTRTLRPALSHRSFTDGAILPHSTTTDRPSPGTGGLAADRSSPTPSPASPDDSIGAVGVTNGAIIPSRRSSLRHSVSGGSASKPQHRSTRKRHSSGSRDLSQLNIDPGLIEEDHQTVRRIRELQEAKEKRDRDTRRDSRRVEKSKARGAVPGRPPPRRSPSNEDTPLTSTAPSLQVAEEGSHVENGSDLDTLGPPTTTSEPSPFPPATPVSQGGDLPTLASFNRDSGPASPSKHRRTFSKEKVRLRRDSAGFDRPGSANSIEEAVDVYLKSPRLTQRARHPQTGRVIAFSEVGDPDGFAVFCCVGMGLTRYLTAFYDELARTLKLRLITPDRPGIGESEACNDGSGTPLNWADDVTIICSQLGIAKFSLLAHSAGAVYALAVALRIPENVRGRIHLMAPWIPPSQMTRVGHSQKESVPPAANVPYSQKILRILPASFLKAANSSFLNARSASLNKTPRSKSSKSRSGGPEVVESPLRTGATAAVASDKENGLSSSPGTSSGGLTGSHDATSKGTLMHGIGAATGKPAGQSAAALNAALRQSSYDERLTQCIWDLATLNANPAVDLITCLERRQPIGFRYFDITRSVVIHHGSKDTRVPVENVRWLGSTMRRCEVRVLDGEGHGLMANASVMGAVLGEVAKEWEDWWTVTQAKSGSDGRRR